LFSNLFRFKLFKCLLLNGYQGVSYMNDKYYNVFMYGYRKMNSVVKIHIFLNETYILILFIILY